MGTLTALTPPLPASVLGPPPSTAAQALAMLLLWVMTSTEALPEQEGSPFCKPFIILCAWLWFEVP
jgi:hypothetical protein